MNLEYVHRVNSDVNGNGRYVVHFIHFADTYKEALKLASVIGGKKYKGKWFGGGIVFTTPNPISIELYIKELKGTS